MIQTANRKVVTTIVNIPNPNSNIRTGTKEESGALANILTHMPSSLLAVSTRPIRKPMATPMTMAKNMPMAKAFNENRAASWEVALSEDLEQLEKDARSIFPD